MVNEIAMQSGLSELVSGSAPALNTWLRAAARETPQAPALDGPEGVMDYAALHAAVSALAQALLACGLQRGDRVAVAASRTQDSVIAILATVEAGVAYVPLDLSYPQDRLRTMLQDAQVRMVVGERAALQLLGDAVGEFPTLQTPAPRAQHLFAAEDDLTYVLFTSGSTGRPKGVAMGAGPLAHLTAWHAAHSRLGRAARTLQFAPLSFDVHFQEIFSTLACGGTLVLLPEADRRDPSRLLQALRERRVERVFLPYVALQMLAEASHDQALPPLREVISAGEQLQVSPAIRDLFRRLPDAELHNHYGPTETHVVTAHELRGDAAAWPDIPPVGLPLPHVRVALRTDSGSGDGSGELLLGGDTLAHGYLGRPELSAERFRTDAAGPPGRCYLTGDLVRRDADGILHYLGRIDQQLKVDGFRIEPGEIEIALMEHPSVREAVVTAPDVPGAGRQLVAHVVPREGPAGFASLTADLRVHLRARLPEYMVPVRYIELERLPVTPSGKIDRRGLPLPADTARPANGDPASLVRTLWQELLGLPSIDDSQNLFDLGARSLLVLRFISRLRELGVQALSAADVYDRPTLGGLAALLTATPLAAQRERPVRGRRTSAIGGIAIIGMSGRAAGAPDVEALWQRLLDGTEGIRHFSPEELDASVPADLRSRTNFVAARGVLEGAGRFDAGFFGISPREAVLLDPQQRLLLELCWNALEDAAIDPSRSTARIGVYAGTANNSYMPALRDAQPELVRQAGEFAAMLASEKDYAATRVANRLDLQGPAVSIHTACSTGLVAVAQAWHALAGGQCDIALAGGATVMVPQEGGYLHVEGGMESADGHCRPFDADASGTVFGSGGAVVVLKRLEDALADGDAIRAVIRGVGLNNDGADKASFTAPSVSGQAGAIRMALEHAQVDARSIGYVEAHGTGTALGDPIEVAALTRAWSEDTADRQFCTLGSLKANFGHTIAAAGVLGLIKATLALERGVIPGTLHFRKPNPHIDFAATPFRVTARNTEWTGGEQPRRAAVSSFGVGGTNAHVVLEEAPVPAGHRSGNEDRLLLLPLSAHSGDAAAQRARDLADHLESHPELALEDVVATLVRGRKAMAQRLAVVARGRLETITALRSTKAASPALHKPRVVFLFPGQGSQHPGMAARLYDEAPAFREALDRCLAVASKLLPADLHTWLVSAAPDDAGIADQLAETRHAQPALFAVSYALAAWLDSLGLQPDAVIGHSIGEYAAACHADVFSLEDGMAAVVARGLAMFEQPRGAMLAVRGSAEAVGGLLQQGVEIAGCNAPNLTVVAGGFEAIDAFARHLKSRGIDSVALRVSHAFHSATMEGALPLVAAALERATLRAPSRPVYSCISGRPLTGAEATDPQYWARQVRAPVQFSRAVQAELSLGETVFVEVGAGQALTGLVRQHRSGKGAVPSVVPLLGAAQDPGDAARQAWSGIGALWCAGASIAWPVAAGVRRAALPPYPFRGEHHWFARGAAPAQGPLAAFAVLPPQAVQPPLPPKVAPVMNRLPRLEQELKRLLCDVSGMTADEITGDASFIDQGLDSLSLTQATLELERVFGLKLRFRRLLEDLDSIDKLARFLDAELPADKFAPPPAPVTAAPAATANIPEQAVAIPGPAVSGGASTGNTALLEHVISQQMQLMAQQLALLSQQPAPASPMSVPLIAPGAASIPGTVVQAAVAPAAPPNKSTGEVSIRALVDKPFGASARITLDNKQDFTPEQRRWLDDFTARYNARTGKSKHFSQQHRKVMADPRVVTGFNPVWKDLVYPIVVDRSKGALLWDLDGNEYIDLLSCFGANLLGYQPPALVEAMVEQLRAGIELGPQHPLAAEVAELIAEFTGLERVAFCNTGSEAVVGALRIARTVTGRKTVAIFTNSYHGIVDEVIVRGSKQLRSLAAAPGIPPTAVENMLVLDYASDDSLRILRERGSELAAIMIEPIQNKYPTLQPREFVQSLREIADAAGCALIFDECVTGFRVAPGGAQEFYGVRGDLACYGKIIGGGLPFSAIAGSSRWMDALDGGHWQYGDDSYPEAGVTYFAGTFVRHPLALAAARASLLHLKRGGRELYRTLNGRTDRLVERLNTAFAVRGAPVKAVHCASLWRLAWDDNQKFVSLFYYLVRFHGLHLYEQFGHFVTEAMGDAETDRIFEVFTKALDELMALGFITKRTGMTPGPSGPAGHDERTPDCAPLSPGQTERWLVASYDEHARRALNESLCLSLDGLIDRVALEVAIVDVVARHEAFCSEFDLTEPLQRLVQQKPLPIARLDLRASVDAQVELDAFCAKASEKDFPLDRPPLAAITVVDMPGERVILHIVGSHLILDGWAASAFVADLAVAYQARALGRRPTFTRAESPRRFAITEQARWAGPEGKAAREYWCSMLVDAPAPLQLGDLKPPAVRRYAADTHRADFDCNLRSALAAEARKHRTTLFQILLTAVTMMLGRRSGQREFVLSLPYASQSLGLYGSLMSDGVLDLPLRVSYAPNDNGETVLRHVQKRLMDALEHPLVTQGTIARELSLPSRGNRPPFTGIFFNLNPKVDLSGFAPLKAQMREGPKRGTLGEILFNFYDLGDRLTLDLHYSTEFFSADRVAELADELRSVCESLAAGMDRPLIELPRDLSNLSVLVQTCDERVVEWNRTARDIPSPKRFEQWVSEQAAQTPDQVAVVACSQSITYGQLEARANRIGHVLCDRGIGPGQLVGLCLGRHVDLIPALLGILKCGAAYVPLDPAFPRDRLAEMAEDAHLAAIVTESAHASLVDIPRERQLRVDDDAALIASHRSTTPTPGTPLSDDALIYVVYTSGSTGKPKGVMLQHRSVCNLLRSMQREPGFKAEDRMLALATLSFDMAVPEVMLPLVTGGRTVLMPRDDAADARVLIAMLEEHCITVMQATPTTCYLLLDGGWKPPRGFKLWVGAEPMPPALACRLLESGVELWNLYGPTETTVWSTLGRLAAVGERVSIGKPIDNTTVWVLDDEGRVCAPGEVGEICIGGAGVARGYLERPQLTAERFVADPFAGGRSRMYRTGDLGCWTVGGTLEHMGRKDHQVKLRGYRIELGEIEARLGKLSGVGRCIVVTREDQQGDVRLVAYVVPASGDAIEPRELREQLKNQLPEYMVPSSFVALPALPLLPNGKIDRKSLPAPKVTETAPPTDAEQPRTPMEALVARTMARVLGVATLGREGHFFELGGHSLLAAKLAALLSKEVGHPIRLRTLFESPTVERLASALDVVAGGIPQPHRAPIVRRKDQHEAPLTLMQERIRFVEDMHPGRVVYNAPSAHRLKGAMDVAAFDRAFKEMVQRQPSLRSSIVPSSDRYIQKVHAEVQATLLPFVDLSGLPQPVREARLTEMLEALAAETFRLELAPLFKARLFKLADDEYALFFMAHHVIWDGWSFDILYNDMSTLYKCHRQAREPDLPALALTYGDYAQWHSDWLKSQELLDQVGYWKKQFSQGGELSLPVGDFPREKSTRSRGETAWMHIEDARLAPVRDFAKRAGTTTSIVMLSVYAAMMSQWLREPKPSIGMPVRGRGTPELDSIMGFFNNMLPIRFTVEASRSSLDWVREVHRTMVAAYASQEAPFELLAAELEVSGNGTRVPLYQAMFSYQDARARQTSWDNLIHERIPLLQKGVTEDINLWMVETPGGIEGGVQYDADLFLPSTATTLRDRFLALLEALVSQPEQPVCSLLAIRPAEREVLAAWGRTSYRPAAGADFLDTIESLGHRNPKNGALSIAGEVVSRGALNGLVEKFCKRLQEAGVSAGGQALIQLRSIADRAAAALALWRQGVSVSSVRCGVPVDTTGLAVVISEHRADPALPKDVCWIEAGSSDSAAVSSGSPVPRPSAISRTQLAEMIETLGTQIKLLPGDRALCFPDDEPALQLFMLGFALSCGAELYVAPENLPVTPHRLASILVDERIAMMHASGSAWHSALAGLQGHPMDLVAVLDVTELNADLAGRLLDKGCTLLSVYRPPSVGIPLAAALIHQARDCAVFGRPLLAGSLQALDGQGQPVPPTVAGELNALIADHVHSTGTLARWRSDGQLQYLGDIDDTAYIDGHRIELAPLRNQLANLPGAAAVAVAVRDDALLYRCLVIGIEPTSEAQQQPGHWKREVHRLLPRLASVDVTVGPLARLSDGSVDTTSLPALRRRVTTAEEMRTPTQRALAQVWQEILGLTDVGLQDNFFELGGTSLTAMHAAQRLAQQMGGRRVSPRRYVFETLQQLAAAFDEADVDTQPLVAVGDKPPAAEAAAVGVMRRLRRLVARA